jgi:hypothetical protein
LAKIGQNAIVTISELAMTASDVARAAILESVPSEHVGAVIDVVALESDDANVAVALHTFEAKSPAYPGWYWAVAVVALDGQDYCTVSEINLLPGAGALVPSSWTPWSDRVQPGDLDVGDLLPAPENDERLTAGLTGLDDFADDLEPLHPMQWEMGLGREQILSTVGLERAVARWFSGDTGPRAAMAKAAPAHCGTCGFLTPIGGSLGQVFGICANEFGAADGQLVATTFGCGAHSSVRPDVKAPVPVVPLVIDDDSDERSDSSDVGEYIPEVTADAVPQGVEGEDLPVGDSEAHALEVNESGAQEFQADLADDMPYLITQSEFVESDLETVDSVANQTEQDVDFVSDLEESAPVQDPVEG